MDLMLKNLKFSSLKLNVESSKFFKEKTKGSSEYNISFVHRFIINQGIDKILIGIVKMVIKYMNISLTMN